MNIKDSIYFISGERFTILTNNKYHTINLSKKFKDYCKSECMVARRVDELPNMLNIVLHTKNLRLPGDYSVSRTAILDRISTSNSYAIIKNKDIIRYIAMTIDDNSL
jgi:hypothetical protein